MLITDMLKKKTIIHYGEMLPTDRFQPIFKSTGEAGSDILPFLISLQNPNSESWKLEFRTQLLDLLFFST